MFSYEDRLRAVQLYIKLDKRIGLTIRQLGYPTKNALLSWHREFEQRLDLPAGYVRQPRYSQAHKELAVRHYLEHGRSIAATIRVLGYPSRSLLSEWLQELNPQGRTRVVGRSPCANMTCSTYPREFSEQRGRYDSPPTTEGIDARRQAHDRYGCTARSPQDE